MSWNKGLYELATAGEVCAYFDQVMQQHFLPSGRVTYLAMCEYTGEGRAVSRVSGKTWQVNATRVVDATYMDVVVPSMRQPPCPVADGAHCVPINALARLGEPFERFNVIGVGKTGMDACLFLLRHGVDPDRISWVTPRDQWMLDRFNLQAVDLFFQGIGRTYRKQIEAAAASESYEDLFLRAEAAGQLMRLDRDRWPTMFRCATVTRAECEQLRRIRNVVRLGHVTRIGETEVTLDEGTMPTDTNTLHVDCTADALKRQPVRPVFERDTITLQTVRACQQIFSGAITAWVEAHYDDVETKNRLCTVVQHPDEDADYPRILLADTLNSQQWFEIPELKDWLEASRVDGFTQPGWMEHMDPKHLASLMESTPIAIEKLRRYVAEHPAGARA